MKRVTEEELFNSYTPEQKEKILKTMYFLMSDYMKKNIATTCDKFVNTSIELENKEDYYLLSNFLSNEQRIREENYKPRKKG